MTPLMTKQQIGKYVKVPENISDLDLDTPILDAQEFDIIAVFPQALIDAIALQVVANIEQWRRTKAYVTGDKVIFETYYTALSNNTDSQPPSASWGANELMNFYLQYLQPYMSYCFYYRFIAYHGANVAQAGLVQSTDPNGTFQPVSDKMRAEILGDIRSKKDTWGKKISKKLNDVNFTFDGTQYLPEDGKNTRVRSGVRIYALGSKRGWKGNCDDNRGRYVDL